MKHFKTNVYKCATIILFVALCSGIGLPASPVSAATISPHPQKENCRSEYKKDVHDKLGKKVGFVYAWSDTCNDNAHSQVKSCSSSTGFSWISIKVGQINISC